MHGVEEQSYLTDEPTKFANQSDGFPPAENEAESQPEPSQIHNTPSSHHPVQPANDVQLLISQISEPKNVITAFEAYKIRSKYVSKEALAKQDNVKIKRYKSCLYFGQMINGRRHGKGMRFNPLLVN